MVDVRHMRAIRFKDKWRRELRSKCSQSETYLEMQIQCEGGNSKTRCTKSEMIETSGEVTTGLVRGTMRDSRRDYL